MSSDMVMLRERKRSSSFIQSPGDLIIKKGILKKKGMFFYNSRLVSLNAKGIL